MENKENGAITQGRPQFLDKLSEAYELRQKNIVVLTGNVNDFFYYNDNSKEDFIPLENKLEKELSGKFNVMRMDIATGISFYDEDTEKQIVQICESKERFAIGDAGISNLRNKIIDNRYNPLVTLVILKEIEDILRKIRTVKKEIKPLCVVFQHVGSLFPEGDFGRLSELDRQRLVFFLSWITDPLFRNGSDLFILINPTKSELNTKITALPNVIHAEAQLPSENERKMFQEIFINKHEGVKFENSDFVKDTAGLTIGTLSDLLRIASKTKQPIRKNDIVAEVNKLLESQLGNIIKIKYPDHKPTDVIGYKKTGEIFADIFERCEDPETAVSAILVSGPNGGGKTFQLEAYASNSNRAVIELTGLRGSYFGETDKFFELLRLNLTTFGKILILVDEAHTAFGSVHASETHETEKRLAGNIIKMMGDPQYIGKILWGLMTSRPDELDPDIKSRAPIQIPIFDLENDERQTFIKELFERNKIKISDEEFQIIFKVTDYYSARDFRNFIAEVKARKKKNSAITMDDILKNWNASKSIMNQREFQTLIAAQHCSYPELVPEKIRKMGDLEIAKRIEELRWIIKI